MKQTVLVVDDEYLIAQSIARNITSTNDDFEVIAIENSAGNAWKRIEELTPDIVFTDICMPEMDGLKLARKISENSPYITCVIVSGYNDFEYAQSAIRYNVHDYLLKPIDKAELSAVLAKISKKVLTSQAKLEDTNIFSREKQDEIVDFIKKYIQNNYGSQIDFESLANSFGLSLSYLTKLFVKCENVTPSRYLREYKINIAKHLLRNKNISISTISEELGYLDQFHFSKSFKSITGMSPSEYRDNRFL